MYLDVSPNVEQNTLESNHENPVFVVTVVGV